MRKQSTRGSTLLLAALLLAACAGGPAWVGTGRSADQSREDLSACREDADSRMQPQEYVPPGQEVASSNQQQMMSQYSAEQHYGTMVGDCMQSKGYRPSD